MHLDITQRFPTRYDYGRGTGGYFNNTQQNRVIIQMLTQIHECWHYQMRRID